MNLRLGFAVGLFILALGGGVALAGDVLDPAAVTRALEPSATPNLLAPISVEGRVGWACEPERAASATAARDAHLPAANAY